MKTNNGVGCGQNTAVAEGAVWVRKDPAPVIRFFAVWVLDVVDTVAIGLPLQLVSIACPFLDPKCDTDHIDSRALDTLALEALDSTAEVHGFALGVGLCERRPGRNSGSIFSVERTRLASIGGTLISLTMSQRHPRKDDG